MCALWNAPKSRSAADKRARSLATGVLRDALDQRAKFRIVFGDGVTSLTDVAATLAGFNGVGLTLEISAMGKASQAFVGAPVTCYLRLRGTSPGSENFQQFATNVTAVGMRENGSVGFTLAMPTEILPSQQRRSVRVLGGVERLPALLVWRELPAGADITTATPVLRCTAKDQPTPPAQAHTRVENISACGLRMLVHNALMSRQLPHQETGETFTFYFKAVGEDESKVFLAQAALRNLFSDPQQGVTSLGFEFTAEGRLNRDKKLVWTPLADNTLPGLGPFIFKWNLLDFYRDKRVE